MVRTDTLFYYGRSLAIDLFIVSSAKIVDKLPEKAFSLDGIKHTAVNIKKANGSKCERCWVLSKEVVINKNNLCNRCQNVTKSE